MKKKALHKEIVRTIQKTLPRFLSIFFIVALGVAFYSGIRVTEKDMKITADAQFDEKNLMDIKLVGTLGLSEENLSAVKKLPEIKNAQGSYSKDFICRLKGQNNEYVVKVMSQPEGMNQPEITEGSMPSEMGECLADENFAREHGLKIGDTITLKSGDEDKIEDSLRKKEFKITGIGKSAEYLSRDRGSSEIGSGKVSGFLVLPKNTFCMKVYTEIYMTVKGAEKEMAYTDAYNHKVSKAEKSLKKIKNQENERRLQEIKQDAYQALEEKEEEYDKNRKKTLRKLKQAEAKMEKSQKKILSSKNQLKSAEKDLVTGKRKLEQGESDYKKGIKQIQQAKKQISAGKKELEERQESIRLSEKKIKEQEAGLNQLEKNIEQYEQMPGANPQQLQQMKNQLQNGKKQIYEAKKKISEGKTQIAVAQNRLKDSQNQIRRQERRLSNAKQTLSENRKRLKEAESSLQSGKRQVAQAEKQYHAGKKKFQNTKKKALKKLDDAKKKLKDARKDIDHLEKGKLYILNRRKTQSYVEYGEETARIGAIGKVFPAIFFLVAALVSLTAMTRMVEEQRTQIGTLKALGYTGWDIALKYVSYGLAATVSGSVIGAVVGEKVLPKVIIESYKMMYIGLGDVKVPLESEYTLMASFMAAGVVTLAVLSVCYKELRERPAQLMRPAAPKEGKRILLERAGFLWKRLSFIWKATMRNMFRYKKRFFMMIFGIGGSMSLLLVGFGLKDSISAISDQQFQKIIRYDVSIGLKEDAGKKDREDLYRWLSKREGMKESLLVHESVPEIEAGGKSRSATMIVPLKTERFTEYIALQNRTNGRKYTLNEEGIFLTEKTAIVLGVEEGDEVEIKSGTGESVRAKVCGLTENYMLNKFYMSPKLYEKLYHKTPKATSVYCRSKKAGSRWEEAVGKEVLEKEAAASVHFISSDVKAMEDMVANLNIVVAVLIISAGLLAFVVLYNLNNINISERRAELATIKVLGFYDFEVGAYVYRENIILTILGMFAGIGMGIILHRYVILTAEVDMIMFGRKIYTESYFYSILLTAAFAVIINAIMYFQLKKINMVESLKSAE